MESWNLPVLIASLVAFLGSPAMWWIYFDTSSKAGSHAISRAENPGQLGAYFHYVHVALVGAIIVCAVANELVIAHPDGRIQNATAAVLLLGPALYLFANALYKRLVYHRFPLSHRWGCWRWRYWPRRLFNRSADGQWPDDADHGGSGGVGEHLARQSAAAARGSLKQTGTSPPPL